MRRTLVRCSALLVCLACSNPGEPAPTLNLETDQTSYVAIADPAPQFDHSATVVVKFRNETNGVIRIHQCTASVPYPTYQVIPNGEGQAAWNPAFACETRPPYHDIASGQERTDTLVLRAPWQRLFNGQPVGAVEGTFRLVYEVQICGTVNRFGVCMINNHFEFARSNRFTIIVPEI